MIVAIGDLHFQDNYAWSHELCENIISHLTAMPENTLDNTVVLLGDLTENHLNSGAVYEYLTRLFKGFKYGRIVILQGNHDVRRRAGKEVTPYDFLKEDPRVQLCSTPGEVIDIEGHSCLMLPHFLPTQDKPSVNKYYASLSGEYDFIFGHVADETATMIPEAHRSDLSKLKGIKCLGHIHTAVSGNYIESVYAGTVKEVSHTRSAWVFDKAKNKTVVPLPTFLEYENITYPEPLSRSTAQITVYTFFGADEGTIKGHYGKDIYIRRIIRKLDSNIKTDLTKASQFATLTDAKDTNKLIDLWKDTMKERLPADMISQIKKYAY
jgi:calcineurin-like phosphoesterase family protein